MSKVFKGAMALYNFDPTSCQVKGESKMAISYDSYLNALITYGAKLLNADWLRQRAFFLNHEGTFGNQEGMIT